MPYATFDDMVIKVGRTALIDKFSRDTSAEERQAEIERYLLTASNKINAVGRVAGYPVPIVAADLTKDTALQAEIDSWLRDKALTIAQYLFFQPLDDTDKVKAAQEFCESELEELRAGTGLPVAPPIFSGGAYQWVPPDGASDRLTPRTLRAVRALPEASGFPRGRLLAP